METNDDPATTTTPIERDQRQCTRRHHHLLVPALLAALAGVLLALAAPRFAASTNGRAPEARSASRGAGAGAESFDLRETGCVSDPLDQGRCGGCWAVVVARVRIYF